LMGGLDQTPAPDPELRKELEKLSVDELRSRLTALDPEARKNVDMKNRRRVVRALEIALVSGRSLSEQRAHWMESGNEENPSAGSRCHKSRRSLIGGNQLCHCSGVFVFRDREELYQRINQRVERMLGEGAIEEVRNGGELSRTAGQMIGVKEIRDYLGGRISLAECAARIQQATRRYAKRQLTWFRNQTNFESLNLSLLNHNEAVEWVLRQAVAAAPGE